eukprot:scaffold96125_cov30-Phaeocystis_antarctica.AAC.1
MGRCDLFPGEAGARPPGRGAPIAQRSCSGDVSEGNPRRTTARISRLSGSPSKIVSSACLDPLSGSS